MKFHVDRWLGAISCSLLVSGWAAPATAQEIALDRWLVTASEVAPARNPLSDDRVALFPDRNVEIGPGTWTLHRVDGASDFDFSDVTGPGETTLAHAYLKSAEDLDVQLALGTAPCATMDVWLNGQLVLTSSGTRDIRLAAGWNTLLAMVNGPSGCPRELSGQLSSAGAPVEQDATGSIQDLRIQASRPPGVRPNYPEGTVSVSGPRITELAWITGEDRLSTTVTYDLTSWGGGRGANPSDAEEPDAPPAQDLSGEWDLRLFGPTGIQYLIARLEMTEDGALSGALRTDERDFDERRRERQNGPRDAFSGRVTEGWVSGRQFSMLVRTELMRRLVDVEFRGTIEDGAMRGTIDLSQVDDRVVSQMESRFEGTRAEEEDAPGPEASAPNEAEPDGGAEPDARPDAAGPRDPTGQRSQMIAQLRGPGVRKDPAPADGSVEVRVGGESLVGASNDLRPGAPEEFTGMVEFRRLREAALDPEGVRAELRWADGDREVQGPGSAEGVLRALHGPIAIVGLQPDGNGVARGELRVPEALAGFTLRGESGSWWVDDSPVTDGLLCSPCERGSRIQVGFRGPDGVSPTVRITDRGYPDLADTTATPAIEWLRALRGDNRAYRDLAGG